MLMNIIAWGPQVNITKTVDESNLARVLEGCQPKLIVSLPEDLHLTISCAFAPLRARLFYRREAGARYCKRKGSG